MQPVLWSTGKNQFNMSAASQIENKFPSNVRARRNVNDFMFGKLIGEGSFSVVYLAKDIHTSKEWAGNYFIIHYFTAFTTIV